ncbi:hypothetical protein G9A89_002714 [Geosiphon pyriformis]|nr:hypothetical protein G9A89_002714 [Geosiphon pyriformis]
MFMKKLVKDVTTSSVSGSLKQKSKILLGKVKHLDDKANLSFKLPMSKPSQYENIDTSSEEKLGHKMGRNLSYGTGSKSDGLLDSHTNTPKAKCFNFGTVKVLSLGSCDFGSAVDDVYMDLPLPVSLEPPLCSVTSVKKRLCFEPTKFFALDIGLLAVPGNTLHDKLKGVKKLFYKINSFGGASTPSKFPDIVRASFTSESSFTLAKQLAVSENLVVNADLKKISIQSDREIIIKEILVNLPKSAIELALVKYGKIFSIKMQLIVLRSLIWLHSNGQSCWSYGKKTCYISKNLVSYVQAHCAVICFDSKEARKTTICSTPVFKGINLVWAGLLSPKCATCDNFGHVFFGCSSGEKTFGLGFKKKFLCSNSDKKHLVLIYAKKQASMSYLVSFGSVTWASVVNSSPKSLSFMPFVKTNIGIGLVDSSTPEVAILALCISVLEHSLKNVSDQIANILHKLNRLLAVLSVSFVASPTSEHDSVLDMAVDTPLFVPPMSSVVTTITQDISLSGSQVLTVKVSGLEASLMVLENSIKTIMNKLDSFGSGITETKLCSSVKFWIANKFPGVRVFTSGLDAGFLGTGAALIINENLAKHVLKIFEIPDRFLIIHLLFKNKQSVSVLGLYAEAFWNRCMIQAGLVNSFIARACNESTFVILSGDFNKDGNKCSSSFSKCVDLGLVNTLVNSSYIKASTWNNSRGVEKTIDFIFISQSLSNALINGQVVNVDEFFNTDHSSVQITIGLSGILDPVLRAIHVQTNKDKLELLVFKLVKTSHSVLSNEFVSLLDVWVSLDSANASVVKFFFLLESHFDAIRSALAKIRKYYCSLKMMESKCAQDSQIKLAIDKKMENFGLNKGQTIRSVLEQPFYKVTLDHLVVNEDLILESGLVKFHVNRIMEGWTRKRIVVGDMLDNWSRQFQLLEYVFDDAFLNIMHPIETDEFFGMVLDLPNNKAAGFFGILNELWKHCDRSVLDSLLVLLNSCLVYETVPGSWKEAWVSMISKLYDWKRVLTNT